MKKKKKYSSYIYDEVFGHPRDKLQKWNYIYDLCLSYEEYSGKLIARREIYRQCAIGFWISTKKRDYTRRKLSKETLQKLGMLNTWKKILITLNQTKKDNSQYQDRVKICIEYERKYKKRILSRTNYKNINIGFWICGQKQLYIKNILSEEVFNELCKLQTWKTWLAKISN